VATIAISVNETRYGEPRAGGSVCDKAGAGASASADEPLTLVCVRQMFNTISSWNESSAEPHFEVRVRRLRWHGWGPAARRQRAAPAAARPLRRDAVHQGIQGGRCGGVPRCQQTRRAACAVCAAGPAEQRGATCRIALRTPARGAPRACAACVRAGRGSVGAGAQTRRMAPVCGGAQSPRARPPAVAGR